MSLDVTSLKSFISGGGIQPYKPGKRYLTGSIVIGSDGNYYRAVAATAGNDPTTDNGTYWNLFLVTTATTLLVAAAGRFTTPSAAYNFVKNAIINTGNTVTISMAAETFVETSAIQVDSPYAGYILFQGAGSGSTTISFSSSTNGFSAYRFILRLQSLNILGTWNYAGAGGSGATGYGLTGALAFGGGQVRLVSDVTFTNFYYGLTAQTGSSAVSIGTISVTGAGDVGIFAYGAGASIELRSTTTVSNCADAGSNLGSGIMAEAGGAIFLRGAVTFSGCRLNGIGSISGANVISNNTVTAGTSTTSGTRGIWVDNATFHSYGSYNYSLSSIGSSSSGHAIFVDNGGKFTKLLGTCTCSSAASHCVRVENDGTATFQAGVTASSSASGSGLYSRRGGKIIAPTGVTASSNNRYGAELVGPSGLIDVTGWTAASNTIAAASIATNQIVTASGATTGGIIKIS